MKTSIAIVDDHHLVAQAISDLIQKIEGYEVLFIAHNGLDLLEYLKQKIIPEIVLLDLNMPEMDGFATAKHLREHYPTIKIIALSMFDREEHIVRMIKLGARGYLPKGCRPAELRQALDDVRTKGYYYSEFLTEKLIRNLGPAEPQNPAAIPSFNDRELEFIYLACTDLTYAEIADKLCVSPRTVDGYRESVFEKLQVKSRIGMAMKAVRLGIVPL